MARYRIQRIFSKDDSNNLQGKSTKTHMEELNKLLSSVKAKLPEKEKIKAIVSQYIN